MTVKEDLMQPIAFGVYLKARCSFLEIGIIQYAPPPLSPKPPVKRASQTLNKPTSTKCFQEAQMATVPTHPPVPLIKFLGLFVPS